MVQVKDKLPLLFIIACALLLLILELKMGVIVLVLIVVFPFYCYFASPKCVVESEYWKKVFKEKGFLRRFVIALFFLVIAFFINYITGSYIESTSGPSIPDLVLNNLKAIDFGPIPVYLHRLVMVVFAVYAWFWRPTKAVFATKAVALLILVRSMTMVLTHLGLPDGRLADEIALAHVEFINFTKDLFFSGHVAMPFLGFLLFKDNKFVKYFLLAVSIFMAFVVLAMRLHYTIDVVAAFFFAYGIYKMAAYFFKKDYKLHGYNPS
jgi:hypothetical protein